VRRALLPTDETNGFVLSGTRALTVALVLQQPRELELQAELVRVGFSPLIPLTVSIQLDAEAVRRFTLGASDRRADTGYQLPAGEHQLKMWIEDPVVNQWVRMRLAGGSQEAEGDFWSRAFQEAGTERRFFYGATAAQPVRFTCNGPALLRLDEYREGRFNSRLQYVPKGEQSVELPPTPGTDESWFQVFVRQTQTNKIKTRLAVALRQPEVVPSPSLKLPDQPVSSSVQLTDYYPPRGQEEGTWSLGVSWMHRRPFEVSTPQDTVENEFAEAGVAYRKQAANERTWFKTEGLARLHRTGDLTLGAGQRVEGYPQERPFDWAWTGEAFVGTMGSPHADIQWSLYTELEIGKRIQLTRRLNSYSSAVLFGHYLSLDADEVTPYDYVDQDLYTSYRDQHRWGGVVDTELEYRPWLDTLLQGSVSLISNEDFTPDNLYARVSWDQLIGAFRGRVAYQFRYFLNDNDRYSSSYLHGLSAGLFVEHWINGRHRIELGGQFGHYWPDSGNSYYLVLRWDLSQGRGYKDYAPRESVFRALRSRRIPDAFNNRLRPRPGDQNEP
jgi:hypothetical protein